MPVNIAVSVRNIFYEHSKKKDYITTNKAIGCFLLALNYSWLPSLSSELL